MLVGAQFALLAGQLLLRRRRRIDWPTPLPVKVIGAAAMTTGVGVAVGGAVGLGAGLTASPLPNEAAQLRTTGLYRWVRHPIYSGLLLASAGRTISSGDRRQLALSAALLALLRYKSDFEELALRARFPGYGHYAQITPRFVPAPGTAGRTYRSERDAGLVCG